MKIKKYLFIFSLSLLTILSGCQNDYQKQLKLMVESLNNQCPIPLGAMGHMTKASYDGTTVTFYYQLTGVYDADSFEQNKDSFHQYMLDNYRSNSDDTFRQLLQAIVGAEADLDVVFALEDGRAVTHHFTCAELSDNMPSYVSDPETYLQSVLQSTRLQLPLNYAEGMICTRIELDSAYFTYYFDCDEDQFDINEMKFSAEQYHEAVKDMLTASSDPSFVRMMNMLKATNRGLRYLYTGTTSGKEAVVTIESEELI